MVINKIITEKTLNYIETLYTYANLQDFLDCKDPIRAYNEGLRVYFDKNLESSKFLGTSHGRDWYKLPNYRIGIMEYDKAIIANQFNVEIQYTQAHMFSLESSLQGLELPFGGDFGDYHIKRVDVSQIVKTPNDYLTNHNYISPYRTKETFSKSGKTETVYLGHRKNGNVLRMYNKSIEMKTDNKEHPIDYAKIELFSQYFGDIEDLYTFELELHRKYLKPTFGIDTLKDLPLVYKAHKDIVGKVRIYEDTDENKKLITENNRDRVESVCLVEYEELARLKKKKYKSSSTYLVDTIEKSFTRYDKSLEAPMLFIDKLLLADSIISRLFGDKDVSIEFEDSEYVTDYKRVMAKTKFLSQNQDDQLFKEANRAFAPIMLQKADDVF